mgnify:CR=1 FL=1
MVYSNTFSLMAMEAILFIKANLNLSLEPTSTDNRGNLGWIWTCFIDHKPDRLTTLPLIKEHNLTIIKIFNPQKGIILKKEVFNTKTRILNADRSPSMQLFDQLLMTLSSSQNKTSKFQTK